MRQDKGGKAINRPSFLNGQSVQLCTPHLPFLGSRVAPQSCLANSLPLTDTSVFLAYSIAEHEHVAQRRRQLPSPNRLASVCLRKINQFFVVPSIPIHCNAITSEVVGVLGVSLRFVKNIKCGGTLGHVKLIRIYEKPPSTAAGPITAILCYHPNVITINVWGHLIDLVCSPVVWYFQGLYSLSMSHPGRNALVNSFIQSIHSLRQPDP